MLYKIVEEPEFSAKIKKLKKIFLRTDDFLKGLYNILSHVPFVWGTPIPKEPGQNTALISWANRLKSVNFLLLKFFTVSMTIVFILSVLAV